MKKTTCRNLRGACDTTITGATSEEMAENSKAHVMEMIQKGDDVHQQAINEMMALPKEEQMAWYQNFEAGFDSLEEA